MMLTKRPGEDVTAFTIRRLRAEFMEEAARIVEGLFPAYEGSISALMDAAEAIRKSGLGEDY